MPHANIHPARSLFKFNVDMTHDATFILRRITKKWCLTQGGRDPYSMYYEFLSEGKIATFVWSSLKRVNYNG